MSVSRELRRSNLFWSNDPNNCGAWFNLNLVIHLVGSRTNWDYNRYYSRLRIPYSFENCSRDSTGKDPSMMWSKHCKSLEIVKIMPHKRVNSCLWTHIKQQLHFATRVHLWQMWCTITIHKMQNPRDTAAEWPCTLPAGPQGQKGGSGQELWNLTPSVWIFRDNDDVLIVFMWCSV